MGSGVLVLFSFEQDVASLCLVAYKDAYRDAQMPEVHVTDPLRLGIALNFAVFYFEVRSIALFNCYWVADTATTFYWLEASACEMVPLAYPLTIL